MTLYVLSTPTFLGDQADPAFYETETGSRDGHEKTSSFVPARRRSLAGDGRAQIDIDDDDGQRPPRSLRRPASMVSMRSSLPRSVRPTNLLLRLGTTRSGQHSQHAGQRPSRTKCGQSTNPSVVGEPTRASIPRLIPSSLAPKMRLPKMTQLWAFLDRIEAITVGDVYTTTEDEDSKGTVHYVLNVYMYREHRRIPTTRTHRAPTQTSSPSPPPLREPDFRVQHRFSSFRKLQRAISKATQSKHGQRSSCRYDSAQKSRRTSHRHCAYCQRVRRFITSTDECVVALGWRAKLSGTVETRKELLGRYVSELLFLAREQRDECSNLDLLRRLYQPSSMYVERTVPGMLRRFLTAQTGENFMR